MKPRIRIYPNRTGLMLIALVLVLSSSCSKNSSEPPPLLPPPVSAAASGPWSSPGTWGNTKPVDNQEVTIPSGVTVTLDENTPALGALLVNGSLVFAERDLEVSAGRIEVSGAMTAGTELAPFPHRAVITLGGNPGDTQHSNGFTVMAGGTLDLHGEERGPGWTRLAQTAPKGSTQIFLQAPAAWRPGDRIVIASTDFDMNQAEEMIVSTASGTTVTLSAPLQYTHWGANESGVEERAEVGLLSRNILVQGYEGSIADGQGGHVMAMRGSTMRISGLEFTRMGLRGHVGRYPIHFHMMGDATGSYIKDSSIHHNFNRCVTIHGSHNVVVSGNVAHDTIGHCYFFEDGIETGNLLENNLGLLTRLPALADRITDSDAHPSTFWITNPDNTLRGNAAAGAAAFGFWYDLPENPTGLSATDAVFPKHVPLREFSANVTHSNVIGLLVDDSQGLVQPYIPLAGGQPDGAPVAANFLGLTGYKNRERGVWTRGGHIVLRNARLADNAIGATFASFFYTSQSFLRDAVIVGESANIGNPGAGEQTGLDGRALPDPSLPDFPIRGFEIYDGLVGVENASFINFQPNSRRQASALGDVRFNRSSLDANNYSAAVTLSNAKAVYFDPPGSSPDRPDDEDGHRSALFADKDGTITGQAGSIIVLDNPFLYDVSCALQAEWNARVCPPGLAFGQLMFENRDLNPQVIAPVTVRRQDSNATQLIAGALASLRTQFYTNLPGQRSYGIEPGGATPQSIRFWYRFRLPGDWIEVSIPYPYSPFKVIRDNNAANPLTAAASLAALQTSTGNVYFHDGANLRLKLMIEAGRTDTTVDVGP